MGRNTATAGKQDLVALNGGDHGGEVARLRSEVARLELELEAERASVTALHAQLAVLSRQLEGTSAPRRFGFLRRKRR